MPPDRDARLARRDTLAGSRRRSANSANRANGSELVASDRSLPPVVAEWLQEQPAWDLYEPGWSGSTERRRVAPASFVARARELHRRLARWGPAYLPLILSYLVVLVCTGWFA